MRLSQKQLYSWLKANSSTLEPQCLLLRHVCRLQSKSLIVSPCWQSTRSSSRLIRTSLCHEPSKGCMYGTGAAGQPCPCVLRAQASHAFCGLGSSRVQMQHRMVFAGHLMRSHHHISPRLEPLTAAVRSKSSAGHAGDSRTDPGPSERRDRCTSRSALTTQCHCMMQACRRLEMHA